MVCDGPAVVGNGYTNYGWMYIAAILVSKSKEDQGVRMAFPEQESVGAFHVLVHMISETLRSGDRGTLVDIESQAALLVGYPLATIVIFCVSNRKT